MLSRDEALQLVKKHVPNKNLVKHMIAVEGVMRRLAGRFGEDAEVWGLAGLLHDLDYMETVDNFDRHGFRTVEILEDADVPSEVLHAIKAHPGHVQRETDMDKALYAIDPLTGLIVAAVLMHPEKKLSALDVEFVTRRFKEKRFAAGANREQISSCSDLGLELGEFIQYGLDGMRDFASELGF
ncbi:phosphohydrolase [candidate division LCP-89 bacterium B3_LCP]|uniref:Phosphohydrolase n=1 Tax=candidate division LCP-89 bacterium B3_LCP TaxID=2012998 RepID=A0A532V1P0_UNCL8|nr:MAG: phosphohydrolase [candidate division LCP-89 bacterium B3_LCP]